MKGVTTSGLLMALGLAVASARAEEAAPPQWVAVAPPVPAAVSLGRPTVPEEPNRRPIAETQIVPATFRAAAIAVSAAVARAEKPVAPQPFPLEPVTPSLRDDDPEPTPPASQVWTSYFAVDRQLPGRVVQATADLPAGEAPPWDCCQPVSCSAPACPAATPFYFQAEYLAWRTRAANLPPLITTGPVVFNADGSLSTAPGTNGILGPGTVVLFGAGTQDFSTQSGARFTAGVRPFPCSSLALEGSYFFLGRSAFQFDADANTAPLLARPFFNLNLNREDVQITSLAGLGVGNLSVAGATRLWGAEFNFRPNLCCGCWYNFDLLIGARYLELNEDLRITERITSNVAIPTTPIQPGTFLIVFDSFSTRNQFAGAQMGGVLELQRGRWTLDLKGKIALGDTHQVVTIAGSQVIFPPNGAMNRVVVDQGGLLALQPNIGRFTQDRFSVVPEFGLNVGYRFTDQFRVFVGYNFLYWTNVIRPGDQIDRTLDASLIPNFVDAQGRPFQATGALRPAVPFRQTDFWAQGLNFGIEYRY